MNQKRKTLLPQRVRELLNYDANMGILTWRQVGSNRVKVGSIAGCDAGPIAGRIVRIDGRMYRASRLVWAHVTGNWPAHPVGTRNNDPRDIRWDNLVEVPLGAGLPANAKVSGSKLTAERLRDLVEYSPVTGQFVRRKTLSNRSRAGSLGRGRMPVGSLTGDMSNLQSMADLTWRISLHGCTFTGNGPPARSITSIEIGQTTG